MPSVISHLCSFYNNNSPVNICFFDLHNFFAIKEEFFLTFENSRHYGKCCLHVKESRKNMHKCMLYKRKKWQQALDSEKPFFDVCPFGVLDYIYPIPKENPCIVMFITYSKELINYKRKNLNELNTINLNELKAKLSNDLVAYLEITDYFPSIIDALVDKYLNINLLTHNNNSIKVKVKMADSFIRESFQADISLTKIAGELEINKFTLARLYKQYYNITIHKQINCCRVDYAKSLITAGYNITKAAFASGFNNSSYFCRTFKDITGSSPKKWEKSQKTHLS